MIGSRGKLRRFDLGRVALDLEFLLRIEGACLAR